MRTIDTLRLAGRIFKTNRLRTFLTILGVSVGLGTIFFLVSLGYGLQKLVFTRIASEDALLSLDVIAEENGPLRLDKKVLDKIKKIPQVVEVSPLLGLASQMRIEDLSGDVLLNAIEPSFFRLQGIDFKIAKNFCVNQDSNSRHAVPIDNLSGKTRTETQTNTERECRDIIVSSGILKMFGLVPDQGPRDSSEISPSERPKTPALGSGSSQGNHLYSQALGKKVKFSLFIPKEKDSEELEILDLDQEFEIKEVIEDETANYVYFPLTVITRNNFESSSSSPNFSDSRRVTKNILDISERKDYTLVKVRVKDRNYLEEVRSQITLLGFSVSTISDTLEQMDIIFKAIQIILAIFGLVALVVASIGMFNTMTIALLEKTREIGIMKALGATDKDIKRLFLTEALIIGFCGGLGGIGVGFLVSYLFNLLINTLARFLGGQAVDLIYTPLWFILAIISFSVIVGFITGIYPSHRASKLNPIDALRYE